MGYILFSSQLLAILRATINFGTDKFTPTIPLRTRSFQRKATRWCQETDKDKFQSQLNCKKLLEWNVKYTGTCLVYSITSAWSFSEIIW